MIAGAPQLPDDTQPPGAHLSPAAALLENMSDQVWSVDLEFRLTACNRACRSAWEQHYGLSPKLGMSVDDYPAPMRRHDWRALYGRALASGECRIEFPVSDACAADVILRPIVQQGAQVGVAAFCRSKPEAGSTPRRQELNYRDIFAAAPVGIFCITEAGGLLNANSTAAEILGYTSALELLASPANSIEKLWVDPGVVQQRQCSMERAGFNLSPHHCAHRKDGTRIWISLHVSRVSGATGEPGYSIGFFKDVTEEKLELEKLEEKQQILDIAQHAANLGVFRWDAATGKTWWSPEIYQLYGLDPEQTTPSFDAWMQQVHSEDRDRLKACLSRSMECADGRFSTEFRVASGARWLAIICQFYRDEHGHLLHVVGINVDVTKRRALEEKLRLESQILLNLSESVILVRVSAGLIIQANERAIRMFGYDRHELLGMPVSKLNAPAEKSAEELFLEISSALKQDGSWSGEIANLRKNGGIVWSRWTTSTFHHQEWGPVWVGVQREISQEKESQQERERLEEQLLQAQKMECIGQLAGGVAHEFNNLLGVINGNAELIMAGVGRDNSPWSYADGIRRAGESASNLTRQLLAFSRQQIIHPRLLDLNGVIVAFEDLLKPLTGDRIRLHIDLEPALWTVKADPEQVSQILMNLAINARDAMPEGGVLKMSTSNVPMMNGKAGSRPFVKITVSDTGTGMDEETCQRVFEPFFTRGKEEKGTGLGLSTVHGIMSQNDGWIDVQSMLGTGSSFDLYFPVAEPGETAGLPEPVVASGVRGAETVLIVEDQADLRLVTREILELHGYQVLDAEDGGQAMAAVERFQGVIDLLLTDVALPGINGKELSLRLLKMRPRLKVLFTSGYAEDTIAHHGVLEAGASFIPKPYGLSALAAKVREVLDKPAPA